MAVNPDLIAQDTLNPLVGSVWSWCFPEDRLFAFREVTGSGMCCMVGRVFRGVYDPFFEGVTSLFLIQIDEGAAWCCACAAESEEPLPERLRVWGEQVAGMVFSLNVLFLRKILAVRSGQQM